MQPQRHCFTWFSQTVVWGRDWFNHFTGEKWKQRESAQIPHISTISEPLSVSSHQESHHSMPNTVLIPGSKPVTNQDKSLPGRLPVQTARGRRWTERTGGASPGGSGGGDGGTDQRGSRPAGLHSSPNSPTISKMCPTSVSLKHGQNSPLEESHENQVKVWISFP